MGKSITAQINWISESNEIEIEIDKWECPLELENELRNKGFQIKYMRYSPQLKKRIPMGTTCEDACQQCL